MLGSRLFISTAALGLTLASCQFLAGLDEERTVDEEGASGSAGGPTNGTAGIANGGSGAGGDGGAGGAGPTEPPTCRVEAARRASHLASGNPSLAFSSGRWGLGRPYFANGVAYSNLDQHGILQGVDDALLVSPDNGWSNDNVWLTPYKGDFLVAVSRRDDGAETHVPTVLRIAPSDGSVLETATGATFTHPWHFEVSSMAVATDGDENTTLVVMRPLGSVATAEIRRFDDNLDSFGASTIPNTWDASAAWSASLDRFGVFVLKKGTPKELWLYSYPTTGDLEHPIQTRIDRGPEVPELSVGHYSISAAASPDHFFVVWTDERINDDPRIYLTRVNHDGERPEEGPDSVWVSEAHTGKAQSTPMVVFDGRSIAVSWRSESRSYFRRFTTNLEPLGEEYEIASTLSDSVGDRPTLAASGPNSYGVAYIDAVGSGDFVFHRVVCNGP